MMKTLLLVLFTMSTLSACTKTPAMTYMPPPKPIIHITDTLSYLALGDSYTIGQSVPAQVSFPNQLAKQLTGYKVTDPTIVAKTGWTTDELITAIDNNSDIKGQTYDIVTLLIGVNDQYGGHSQTDYREKFVQVLNTAIKFAKGNVKHVFVLSIPDYGVTPFAHGDGARIGREIDEFNVINEEESDKAGVHYTDITAISKLAANNTSLIADDGLHPSSAMYQMWVDKLKPVILAELKTK